MVAGILKTDPKFTDGKTFGVKEREQMRPRRRQSVTDWADEKRYLPAGSVEPGKYKSARAPFQRGVQDAMSNPLIEDITLVAPTQILKTETELNFIGWIIENCPGPIMMMMSTEKLMKRTSRTRIQKMIDACPTLKVRYYKKGSDLLCKEFAGCVLIMTGANSTSELASTPIMYLIADEIDKYPEYLGNEADPLSLAEHRTDTFEKIRKRVYSSSPTIEQGLIWRKMQGADVLLRYHVPCPNCGTMQTFTFDRLKYLAEEEVIKDIWYECSSCGARIDEHQKRLMNDRGDWLPVFDEDHPDRGLWPPKAGRRISVAFHINALYSPWVSWEKIALKFIKAKENKITLQDFFNNYMAQAWKDTVGGGSETTVHNRCQDYPMYSVPEGAIILFGGLDVQDKCFYTTIRAFAPKAMTSWLVAAARLETWKDVEDFFFYSEYMRGTLPMLCALVAADTGFRTKEVYDFCVKWRGLVWPVKGDTKIDSEFSTTRLEKYPNGDFIPGGLVLYRLNTHHLKDEIWRRIYLPPEEDGGWNLCRKKDLPADYAKQICSESKTAVKKRGTTLHRYEWAPKYASAANHYLDDEVYMMALARIRRLQQFPVDAKPITGRRTAPAKSTAIGGQQGTPLRSAGGLKPAGPLGERRSRGERY